MPHILQLSSHVSDLIAAGEVVERPASVAKELLENAIDAGATAIVVEMRHGGLSYLRITDNGCGIAPEELPTAFLRHATSKLRSAGDLAAIGTLGFRGEALAAISAVSHVDIFSRTPGADSGAQLHLDGGVPGEVTEVGCPEGTTIVVRDLFYNTPARMKFMKKDTAEGAAVSGIVQHLSLSHPGISFKLLRDGAEVLHTPGDGTLEGAVYAALGREFAMNLLPIEGSSGSVALHGFITPPLKGHGTRARQIFFVNGRFVKSQLLSAALEGAYKNQIMKGKFPGCVLHVYLPCEQVDVNVHPAKTVVKFAAENAVFDAVYYTALDVLNGGKKEEKQPEKPFFQTMTAEEYRESRPAEKPAKPAVKPPVGSYTVRPMAVHDVAPEKDKPFIAPAARPGRSYEITPPAAPAPAEKKAEQASEKKSGNDAAPIQLTLPQEPVSEQQALEVKAAPWRIAGEVLKTYIICEDEAENVWLIDKHAAHERIRFDALKARTEPVMAQTLLSPIAVDLPDDGYAAVLEQLPLLQEFGFGCEDFGDGTVLMREIPADIRTGDAAATLEELAQKLVLGRADPAAARDELLHTVACKSAIKAGMTTSDAELRVLVDKVQSGEIRYCPHGRPVKYRLSKYEIEKMFKRA